MTATSDFAYPFPSGLYSTDLIALKRRAELRDPAEVVSLFGEVTAAQGVTEILPTPPIGYAWIVDNSFAYANPNAAGGTATVKMRLGAAGHLVDQRAVAQSTQAKHGTSNTSLQGGLVAESSVTLEVTAGTSVQYIGTAWLAHVTKIRYWRSPALTDSFQAVTLPDIPDGHCLVVPHAAPALAASVTWHWSLNLDVAVRTTEFRITRGATSILVQAFSSTGAGQRTAQGVALLPPLIAGDTLEAKCTAAPAADVYVGGAFLITALRE